MAVGHLVTILGRYGVGYAPSRARRQVALARRPSRAPAWLSRESVGATERPQGGALRGASEGGFVRLRACRRLGGPQGQGVTPSEGLCRRCLAPQAPPLKPPSEDHLWSIFLMLAIPER